MLSFFFTQTHNYLMIKHSTPTHFPVYQAVTILTLFVIIYQVKASDYFCKNFVVDCKTPLSLC